MALRPGRQRRGATPIIAKGYVYPLQNQLASKSAAHNRKKHASACFFDVNLVL